MIKCSSEDCIYNEKQICKAKEIEVSQLSCINVMQVFLKKIQYMNIKNMHYKIQKGGIKMPNNKQTSPRIASLI